MPHFFHTNHILHFASYVCFNKKKKTSLETNMTSDVAQGEANVFRQFPLQNMVLLPWEDAKDELNMLALLRQV